MASSTTKRSLCKACNKAPSVFFCQGCQKDFCTGHAKEHRQELSKQLDTIILEHDQLKQNLAEYRGKSNRHPLMQEIDRWEMQSIDKIRKAAADARKTLSNSVDVHTTKITEDLKHLTQELTTARSEDNFIEIDLKEWMERLKTWTKDLNAPSSINIQQEKSNTPFIQKIVVSSKNNKFFERSAGKMKIDENGQVVTAESEGHSTTRCQGEYSSGQHKFRFKIERMHALNWIHFGIVSKNISLRESSHNTPTTFGWATNSAVFRDAIGSFGYNGFKSDMAQNDTIELFLDCDRQIIRLKNERTNKTHEMNVNVTQCPLPWQLHIGLLHQNDQVRYLPS
jgi:hypothetical protein